MDDDPRERARQDAIAAALLVRRAHYPIGDLGDGGYPALLLHHREHDEREARAAREACAARQRAHEECWGLTRAERAPRQPGPYAGWPRPSLAAREAAHEAYIKTNDKWRHHSDAHARVSDAERAAAKLEIAEAYQRWVIAGALHKAWQASAPAAPLPPRPWDSDEVPGGDEYPVAARR